MKQTPKRLLPMAFGLAFLAVGIPYWQIPYADVTLHEGLLGFGLGVVAVGAMIARAWGRTAPGETLAFVGAAVPAAVVLRIIVEGLADRTSHNLAGIEVMIAVALGLAAAGAGVVVGSILLAGRRNAPAG